MFAGRYFEAGVLVRWSLLSSITILLVLASPPSSIAESDDSGGAVVVDVGKGAQATVVTVNDGAQCCPAKPESPPAAAKPEDKHDENKGEQQDEPCSSCGAEACLKPVTEAGRKISSADFASFITEQVRLYYFADVPTLMKLLNAEAFEISNATSLNDTLTDKRGESELAQQKVNDAIQEVDKAQAELAKAQGAVKSAEATLTDAQGALTAAQADQLSKNNALSTAQTELKQAQDEQAKLAAGDDATKANEAVTTAEKEVDDAKAAAGKAQTAVGDAQTAVDGAKTTLSAAQVLVDTAKDVCRAKGDELEDARVKYLIQREEESMAFADRRDRPPFWVGPIDICSHDPLRRIFVYGFPDSQTLLLRGCRDDVKEAREVIAALDQPAPQTKLTLWTLELNVEQPLGLGGSSKSAEKVNQAMDDMETEFRDCREEMAAALSILRDVVVEKVLEKTNGKLYVTDRFCTNNVLVNLIGYPLQYPQRRFFFYEPEVLYRLGFIDSRRKEDYFSGKQNPLAEENWWDKYYYTKYTIPDPANITTLGEALTVLCLARDDYRKEVFGEYQKRFGQYMQSRKLDDPCRMYDFSRLRRSLNADSPNSEPEGLTGTQLVIVNGLQREASEKFFPAAYEILADAELLLQSHFDLASMQQREVLIMEGRACNGGVQLSWNLPSGEIETDNRIESSGWLKSDTSMLLTSIAQMKTHVGDRSACHYSNSLHKLSERLGAKDFGRLKELSATYSTMLEWLYNTYGITPAALVQKQTSMRDTHESFFAPGETDPDIAKADQLLKELNIAMEDDLDEMFVQPMLRRLRNDLVRDKVNVGVVQRTSLLATNRLPAQIDPHVSAELAIGETQDVLAAATQLNTLMPMMGWQELGSPTGRSALLDKLAEDYKQTSEDENSQIYAITSGNRFKVTPIFDPSGQAQRFRFDYVYGNIINDPDGSSGGPSPRLPRTESITIDTEAQVSNFEIRELARFESNAKLGRTERKSGGIPVLNDIPGFRDIPLIGWFKRRGGSSAVVQHTIIFAQSTMYPTIGDIMDVLTQPLPDVEYLGDANDSQLNAKQQTVNASLQTQGEMEKCDGGRSCVPSPPAPESYMWKGQVQWQQLITAEESAKLCEACNVLKNSGLTDSEAAELAARCKCKQAKHCHPAGGLQVMVFEENAPDKVMKTTSAVTLSDGSFSVQFSWNERYRYRLAVFDETAEKLLYTTKFKFIPWTQNLVYDSSTANPITVYLSRPCYGKPCSCTRDERAEGGQQ